MEYVCVVGQPTTGEIQSFKRREKGSKRESTRAKESTEIKVGLRGGVYVHLRAFVTVANQWKRDRCQDLMTGDQTPDLGPNPSHQPLQSILLLS